MANETVFQQTELATSPAADDYVPIWDTDAAAYKRISIANLSGGGTLTGGGVVATGGFTLTVPATGTAVLLGTAQTITGAKTFSAAQTFSSGLHVTGGNSGFGTASPAELVHVKDDAPRIKIETSGVTTESASLEISSDTTSSPFDWFVQGVGSDGRLRIVDSVGSAGEAVSILQNGLVGIGTDAPTHKLDINANSFRLRISKTPSTASATGTTGQIAWDANFLYICTNTNQWRRVAHASW